MARKHDSEQERKQRAERIEANPYAVNAVSPSRLEFREPWALTEDTLVAPMCMTKYATWQRLGWISSCLTGGDLKAPVCIRCRPYPASKLADQINHTIAKSEFQIGENMMSPTALKQKRIDREHAEEMADMLLQENARIFLTTVYVLPRGGDADELSRMREYMDDMVYKATGNHLAKQFANTEDAFFGASPAMSPDPWSERAYAQPMPAVTIARGLPFEQPGIDDMEGIPIGTDEKGGYIRLNLELHTEERPNGNIFIEGETGSGKSTLGKHIVALEHLLWGTKVIVLNDPEGEYGEMALRLGGEVSQVNKGIMFSPFEPRNIGAAGDDDGDAGGERAAAVDAARREYVLASTIPFLKTFFQIAFPSIDGRLADTLDYVLELTYADYGYTTDTTFAEYYDRKLSYPVMRDVYDKLAQVGDRYPAYKDDCDRLRLAIRPAAIGHDKHMWNQRTSFKSHTDFTVIDTRGLSEDEHIMAAQKYNILTWGWSQVRAQRFGSKYIRLVFDEVHTLVNAKSVDASLQVRNIVQRIRKYGGGVMFMTQMVSDLLAPEIETYGRSIVGNCCYKFFGMNSDTEEGGNLHAVQNLLNLTDEARDKLGEAPRGRFIVGVGKREKSWVSVDAIDDWEFELFGQGGGK